MQSECAAEERLSRVLETHFCDIDRSEGHESLLRRSAGEYLGRLDLGRKARLFDAMAEESRLGILALLAFREMCVCELTAALDMTQPNLTYHVKKLEAAGLVGHDKRGKWVYYSLADEVRRQLERMRVFDSPEHRKGVEQVFEAPPE